MIEIAQLQPTQMPWEPAQPTNTVPLAALSPSPTSQQQPQGQTFDLEIGRRHLLEIAMDQSSLLGNLPPDAVNALRNGILAPQEAAVKRGIGSPITLASLFLQCGDIEGARNALAHVSSDDYWGQHMLAMCHWRAGERNVAEDLLRGLASKNPLDPRPLHARGKLLAELERFSDAVVVLRAATRIDAESPILLNDLAAVLIVSGESREALRTLRIALRIDPTYALALANSGVAHQQLGHSTKAANFFHRALVVDDRCLAAVHNLAENLLARHAWDEASELLRPYIERVPQDARAHELLAWAHMSSNRWRDAQRVLESGLRLRNNNNPGLLNNLATVYSSLGELQRAQSAFHRAVMLAPENSQIRANYAHLLATQNAWTAILEVLREKDVDSVSDRAALLANSMLATSATEDAVRFLRSVLPRFHELRLYQMLGNALASRLGRPEEAIEVYEEAIKTFQDDLLFNNLGYALILASRVDEARRVLEPVFVRRRDGSDVTSLCVIASYGLLQIRQGHFDEGISLYREAHTRAGGVMKKRIKQKIQVEEGRHHLEKGRINKAQGLLKAGQQGPDFEFRAQAEELLTTTLD